MILLAVQLPHGIGRPLQPDICMSLDIVHLPFFFFFFFFFFKGCSCLKYFYESLQKIHWTVVFAIPSIICTVTGTHLYIHHPFNFAPLLLAVRYRESPIFTLMFIVDFRGSEQRTTTVIHCLCMSLDQLHSLYIMSIGTLPTYSYFASLYILTMSILVIVVF